MYTISDTFVDSDTEFELEDVPDIALFNEELPPMSEIHKSYVYYPWPQAPDRVMPNHIFRHFFFYSLGHCKESKWIYGFLKSSTRASSTVSMSTVFAKGGVFILAKALISPVYVRSLGLD